MSWTISHRFSHLIFLNNSLDNLTDCKNYQSFFILYFPLHYILFITQSLLISISNHYAKESTPPLKIILRSLVLTVCTKFFFLRGLEIILRGLVLFFTITFTTISFIFLLNTSSIL